MENKPLRWLAYSLCHRQEVWDLDWSPWWGRHWGGARPHQGLPTLPTVPWLCLRDSVTRRHVFLLNTLQLLFSPHVKSQPRSKPSKLFKWTSNVCFFSLLLCFLFSDSWGSKSVLQPGAPRPMPSCPVPWAQQSLLPTLPQRVHISNGQTRTCWIHQDFQHSTEILGVRAETSLYLVRQKP